MDDRIAGIRPLARGEHHDHLAAFEFRLLLDLGQRGEVAAHALEQLGAELLVGELPAAEAQGDLDLVAFLEEPPDRAHFHVVIVIVDHGPELDLLDLDDLLLLARLGGLLLLLVFEFAVIEDFADRGALVGDDLDEVQPLFGGDGERVADRHDAVVLALLIDQLHLANANLVIDARAVLLNGQRGFHRETNGEGLLCLLQRTGSRLPARIHAPAVPRYWGPKKIGRNDAEVNAVPETAPHPAGRRAAAVRARGNAGNFRVPVCRTVAPGRPRAGRRAPPASMLMRGVPPSGPRLRRGRRLHWTRACGE